MKKAFLIVTTFLSVQLFAQQDELKVGIIQYKSAEKVNETFIPLMDYLGSQLGRKVNVEIVADENLGFLLSRGDYDLGIFTTFPYLKAKVDFPELSVFGSHLVDREDHYKGYILAKAGIKNFGDLKEKEILFVKESSTSGYKIPKGVLTEFNIDLESEVVNYRFSGDHTASLWALDSGKVDAIAVDDKRFNDFDGPNKSKFSVLSEFEVPYHAYVFSPDLDQDLAGQIRNLLFNAHKDPEARDLFNNSLEVTQIVPKDDNYYNDLRRYMRIVRVKPNVVVSINPTANTLEALGAQKDLIPLIEGRIQQELQNSHRFGEVFIKDGNASLVCSLDLFSTEEGIFNYQIKVNNKFIGDGELSQSELRNQLPIQFAQWLLKSQPLETQLLFNGEDWFITFGIDDGVTSEDYSFVVSRENGKTISLNEKHIESMSPLNIVFKENEDFKQGQLVSLTYDTPIGDKVLLHYEDSEISTWNIFSSDFWASGFWDKLGLIGGVLIALISAIVGRLLANRKKRRFKNILYQTNDLIKEYVEGHYKLETKLIEQKDFISKALEEGHINENQFLILKHRIEDMQSIVEAHQKRGDIILKDDQTQEIKDIVKDGKITEREFSRIMTIIKKGATREVKPDEN
ncbi:MAG: PhnD/SsuA/transferrin family substrate-binding protein [Cyclobacteriaceae bacterium]